MNYPSAAETTAPEPSRGIEAIFRPAQGPELLGMFGRLATLGEHQDITVPVTPGGDLSPRTILVQSRELRFKRHALRPIDVHDAYFTRSIIEQVPGLEQPKNSLVSSVSVRQSKRGDHYVSLDFGKESVQELVDERIEIWQEMEARIQRKLGWKAFVPDMLAVIINKTANPQVNEHIVSFIERQLPLEVTLDPVYDPATK